MLFTNQAAIIPGDFSLKLEVGNGHGSTNTVIRRFTNTISNTITAYATYADSAGNGGSVTILVAGWYYIAYEDLYSTNDASFGVSVNSNQLTTNILSITNANRITLTSSAAANRPAFCAVLKYLNIGDVVRAHTNGSPDGSNVLAWFYMAKVA